MKHQKHQMENEILYQIFLRTFSPDGTLKKATEMLPHVASTGVTTIYLAPVFEADDDMDPAFWSRRQKASESGNPKNTYRMKDYFHVDPEYGTDEELHTFVEKAHELGLKVLFDLVYFHCGPKATFLYENPDFCEWENGAPKLGLWNFPVLNYECQGLREYLWSNMEYFVREYDVDGYRCDVGDRIPLDFWAEGIRRIRAIKPELMMLNEGHDTDYLTEFDIQYCWEWRRVIIGRMITEKLTAQDIRSCVLNEAAQGRAIRYTENHDTASDSYDERFEKMVPTVVADACMVMNFVLPGVPLLYNGQEVLDTHNCNMFCNRFYRPGNVVDWSMLCTHRGQRRMQLIRDLCDLYRKHPVLRTGDCELPDTGEALFTVFRMNEDETLQILWNTGEESVPVEAGEVLLSDGYTDGMLAPKGWLIAVK